MPGRRDRAGKRGAVGFGARGLEIPRGIVGIGRDRSAKVGVSRAIAIRVIRVLVVDVRPLVARQLGHASDAREVKRMLLIECVDGSDLSQAVKAAGDRPAVVGPGVFRGDRHSEAVVAERREAHTALVDDPREQPGPRGILVDVGPHAGVWIRDRRKPARRIVRILVDAGRRSRHRSELAGCVVGERETPSVRVGDRRELALGVIGERRDESRAGGDRRRGGPARRKARRPTRAS